MALDPITKKILIAFGIVLLVIGVGIAAIVGFAIYMTTDPEFSRDYDAKQAEGREFGKNTDQRGCMEEGLRRAKAFSFASINQVTLNGAFVEECLKTSRSTPGFCDSVPSRWKMDKKGWQREQCRLAAMDDLKTGCVAVFDVKINFCSK